MSQFDLLESRRFLPLFVTQFLGALNDNIYKNALIIFIAFTLSDKTEIDGTILVILAGGIFILPFFLFSATAGQIADKYEKSMLIRGIKLAEILIMMLATVGFITQSLILLMTVLFLTGVQSTFFGPLKYGILPQHLEVRELTGGNGLVQMGTYLAILGGTIIGGVLIAIQNAGVYLVSVTVLTVAATGWFASRYIPVAAAVAGRLDIDWNIFRQTFRIIGYALTERSIIFAILAISWFWFIGATYLSLVPGYARGVLMGNELVATLLLTAFSVGIGAGALLCERFSSGRIEPGLVPIGALGLTLFALDLFLIGYPRVDYPVTGEGMGPAAFLSFAVHWRVLIDLVGIGFCGGIYIVPLYAMVQHRSSPDHRARVIAATNIINSLFMVISAVLVIFLIQMSFTIPQIYLLVAVLNFLITGTIFLVFREYLQRLAQLLKSAFGMQVDL